MTALFSNKFQLTALLLAIALVAGALFMRPRVESVANGATTTEPSDDDGAGDTAVPVGVIEPKHDPNFKICVTQPAYVDAYYRVDLRARVAGPALSVTKAIGDQVKTGEELITISVPDLAMDVSKKEAIVEQRRRELQVAEAFKLSATANVKIAAADIQEKEADVTEADATTAFRKQELARFEGLARVDKAITDNIVEERRKFYEAAAAAGTRARAAVEKAKAAKIGADAKLEEAKADEKLKDALIQVAVKDRDLTRELFGFGTLRAPFDGRVTRRNVDPGTFVQNSASSPGPALLTLERTELVTVYSNIPDNFAPYVDEKTEGIIEMSELPGVLIRGVVTRYSQSLQNPSDDRTMRVEMDLYNRGPKAYRDFLNREKATKPPFRGLKGGKMPIFPEVSSRLREKLGITRLMPGMYGTMKLVLRNFRNAHLIPSQAVFSKGGKSYIYLVKDDTAHLTTVDVQVDDGVLAKVVVLEGNRRDRRRELTPEDRIVLSNQGELSDAQTVKPSKVAW
jgi:multidrug efflux pump subunit AcrA (membrane-fusion protein)